MFDEKEQQMTDAEMMAWIDKATYQDLLRTWRHAQAGSGWFTGEVAGHFMETMSEKQKHITDQERVAISKRIGW
jgi:hypothetical protein